MTDAPGIASRRFRHERLLVMTLPAYEHAVRLLAAAAEARFAPVSAVVAIANGGLVPAGGISGVLDVPNYRLTAQHNPTDAIYTEATGHVTCDLSPLAAALGGQQLGGTVLLVDDICGSGATFTAVQSALHPHLQLETVVRTVALCRNAGTSLDPDLWVWTVDDWVCFPWEPPSRTEAAVEELPILERVEPA
ncbi:phosphoribosyltransferase [Phytohabitans houttuyneae]|uniref:Phosphoribosyltransferase domain-containing protein n=1 Tax=Phytohabitans houttuyneae TaxID=1076126 RepID=A0A6V8KRD1_9ACTN|nr:phosphoribosyltransferase family protein [Phytohabitans houttuyneae]GFJ84911.1 hypothetical protein Phou_090910 [Phytohabitans houttuyneae]